MKAWVLLVIGLLVFSSVAAALPNAQVELVPLNLYESNTLEFNLSVNNFLGNEIVNYISLILPGFEILDAIDFYGWNHEISDSAISWNDGSIETNIWRALFLFRAKAGLVDSDQSIDIPITLGGETGESITVIELTLLNDDSAPELSENNPEDGDYVRQGVTDYNISVNAVDSETGIKELKFSYWECDNENASVTEINLNCEAELCSSAGDFSSYKEGEEMCFLFTSINNAEGISNIEGRVGFDGTAPLVELIAPADGDYGGENTIFRFTSTDNLASVMQCTLLIDSEEIDSVNAANGEITSTTYNLSSAEEGSHLWFVRCADAVGLTGDSSSRNIIIDKTAPLIILNSPANGSMIGDGVTIDIDVTDNYEIDSVEYSLPLESSELLEGENVLVVNATDMAGNFAQAEYLFIVDRTMPTLNLISPADNESVDVHVEIVFDLNDNIDSELDCNVYFDDSLVAEQDMAVGDGASIDLIMPMGDYEWYLECSDEAGNSAATLPREIHVTDITGPDIISDIVYVARGEDYDFDVNVTDVSGVSAVAATFDSEDVSLLNSGDLWSGVIKTDLSNALGEYSLIIDASDNLGNPSSLTDDFTLIQGYIITINAEPSSVTSGSEITVSGTAVLDDGSAASEENITLYLSSGTVELPLVEGKYTYTYIPEEGTHTLRAVIVSSEGYEHSASTDITVNPIVVISDDSGSNSNPSDSGSSRQYCGDGRCQNFEGCDDCPQDCGECTIKQEVSVTDYIYDVPENENLNDLPLPEEEPRVPMGVGKATSWWNPSALAVNPFVWIVFLMLIAGLFLVGKDKGARPAGSDWDDYFRKRR